MYKQDLDYYAATRKDLMKYVPENASRILEVGCGQGLLAKELKENRSKPIEVIGIEVKPEAASIAQEHMDRVFVGNVEQLEFPFEADSFDCLVYGDVLEHLINPWQTLSTHCHWLKKTGLVVASIPNIAHYRTIKMLKKGLWRYEHQGVMDKSHLRFFTLESIQEMFLKANLDICKVERKISASANRKFYNLLVGGRVKDELTEQYIIVAKKKG